MKKNPHIHKKLKIIFVSLCLLLCSKALSQSKQNILILHSAHKQCHWAKNTEDGILEALGSLNTKYEVYTEFLDYKRFPNTLAFKYMRDILQLKFAQFIPDIVLADEEKALEFAIKNRDLFPNAPIVFSGIEKKKAIELIGTEKNITGVYKTLDIAQTVNLAYVMLNKPTTAYIINDITPEGIAIEKQLYTTLHAMYPTIPVWSLSALDFPTIQKILSSIPPNTLVFVGSYQNFVLPSQTTANTIISALSQISKAPLFIFKTNQLGSGAIGGSLLDPAQTGRQAGLIAAKILTGTKTEQIPATEHGIFSLVFDYNVVNRFQITQQYIPSNAVFINNAASTLYTYRREIIIASVFFLIMLVIFDVLIVNFRRIRILARELSKRNSEILHLNADLYKSEDNIREQYVNLQSVQNSLLLTEERYRLAVLGSNDALWNWDFEKNLPRVTSRWFEMTGYPETENQIINLLALIKTDDKEAYKTALEEHFSKIKPFFECEARVKHASNKWIWMRFKGKGFWNDEGIMTSFAGSISDIDEHKRREEEIENLAYYDQLTEVPNRLSAIETTTLMLCEAKEDTSYGLIFTDIDNFKFINDTYGHLVGDKVLVQVAKIFSSLQSEYISLYRIGGDEFILFISETTKEQLEKYVLLVQRLLNRKIDIEGRGIYISVSAGIAIYPEHASSFNELLQNADAALHKAKQDGKTRYSFFNGVIQQDLILHLEIENGLRTAIEHRELFLEYQPQIHTASGRIEGAEALVRWNNPRRGLINPGQFISIAESSGQIVELGYFVFQTAAQFLREIVAKGNTDFSISVNVSVKQLIEKDFVKKIITITEKEQVLPSNFSLEITESFLIESIDHVTEKLHELKTAGFKVSLDDFGQGYSSLSYLKTLPIDFIKIDKVFIDSLLNSESGPILTRLIIQASHELGMKVVAEGVETEGQVKFLKENSCDFIQGFFYSKPVSDTVLMNLLKTV